MKHLKIFLSILFFSFLGSIQNQLLAQEPTKNGGYWGTEWKADTYLENGNFRAKLVNGTGGSAFYCVLVVIYNKSDNSVVRSMPISCNQSNTGIISISLIKDGSLSSIRCTTEAYTGDFKILSRMDRENNIGHKYYNYWKVLNKDVEVYNSCYFQLESDGRFVIYNEIGPNNSAGTPILELVG